MALNTGRKEVVAFKDIQKATKEIFAPAAGEP
jgi:hypothetical protein